MILKRIIVASILRAAFAAFLLSAIPIGAHAQSAYPVVVAACGATQVNAGAVGLSRALTVDTYGMLCMGGSPTNPMPVSGNVGLVDSTGAVWGTDGNPIVFRVPTGTSTGVAQNASNGSDGQAPTTTNQQTNSWLYGYSTASTAWNRLYSTANALWVQIQANAGVVIGAVQSGFTSTSTSAAPDAIAAGTYTTPRTDNRGQAMTSQVGSRDPRTGIVPTLVQNAASLVIQGSDTGLTGRMLFHFEAENSTATPGWVVEYDATVAPSGASPVTLTTSLIKGCHPLPANGEYAAPIRNIPKSFANGTTVLISSTTCLGAAPTWTYGVITGLIEGEAR